MIINSMTDPNGAALLYMVLHGSHQQKNPINVSINIPAPAGSVMGNEIQRSLMRIATLRSSIPKQLNDPYPMTDPWCWYINANIKGVY